MSKHYHPMCIECDVYIPKLNIGDDCPHCGEEMRVRWPPHTNKTADEDDLKDAAKKGKEELGSLLQAFI